MNIKNKASTAWSSNKNVEKNQNPVRYTQFSTRYDSETGAIWCWMQPDPRPCINTPLIDELTQLQQQLTNTYQSPSSNSIWSFKHLILASKTPGIYNLGGDLDLFMHCIENNQQEKLRQYAHKCIHLVHQNISNLNLPISMISLVQGQALGGGFETALSCDTIIAERSSQMGFPEIMFNMFPGMGAYHLLARKVGSTLAERIILSGETYSAGQLYDMGIIDILAEDGTGQQETDDYMKSHNRSHNTIHNIKKIRRMIHPITSKSLYDVVDLWVQAAMNMSQKDLSKMKRLLQLQKDLKDSKTIEIEDNVLIPRRGEWRKVKDVNFPLTTHLGDNVLHNRRKNDTRRHA
ncbi:MAG: crotonase/enoyl-CoA hydratase family protein [Gammaproteobacteria bacterium]|nr:crotonase/enoyl-CoA hydratase family protein [Gammaproteobacteria bacterium]